MIVLTLAHIFSAYKDKVLCDIPCTELRLRCSQALSDQCSDVTGRTSYVKGRRKRSFKLKNLRPVWTTYRVCVCVNCLSH